MKQIQFFPGNLLPHHRNGTNGNHIDDHIHGNNLYEDCHQLSCHDPSAADGMGQQKFRRSVLLLLAEHPRRAQRCKECPAQSQHIAALNRIESDQRSEIQSVHAECFRKRSHRSEHIIDSFHLPFHLRKKKNADYQKGADSRRPDRQREPALPQFMFYQCHNILPFLSFEP